MRGRGIRAAVAVAAVAAVSLIAAAPGHTWNEEATEGCTPGYWKQSQHFHSWDAAGYSTTQTIGSVFSNASAFGLNNYTLLEGLSFEGGNSTKDAAKILLRAAIAAVLNSAHPTVDYAMSTADVVAAVNAALTSDDRNAIISLGLQLDTENNRGCELN